MDKKILKTGLPLLFLAAPLQAAPALSHLSGRAGSRFAKISQQHQTSSGAADSRSFAAFATSQVAPPQEPQLDQSQILSFLQHNNLLGPTEELSTSTSGQLDSRFFKTLSNTYVCNPPWSTSGCGSGGGDTLAPTFDNSTPTISNLSTTALDLTVDINEAGTIYYVIVPDGAQAPTAAQVKAGTAAGGGAALKAGSQVVSSANYSHKFSISGLTAATNYDIYVVAQDSASSPNLQSAVTKRDITTSTDNALYFDGNAKVTGLSGISPASFTVEFRLFLASETPPGNWQGIYWTDNSNDTGIFIEDNYAVSLWTTSNTAYKSNLLLTYGAWNHVAISYSPGNGVRMYINGVLSSVNSTGSPGAGVLPLTNVTIGYGPGNFGLPAGGYALGDSALEDFRIWNVERTQQQINDNKGAELAPPYSANLVRYYDFNHGIGGAVNSAATSLSDRTGNSAGGVLENFTLNGTVSNWVLVSSLGVTAPTVSLSVNPASIAEATGTATVTATLSAAAASATTVNLATSGTATGSGTDYNLSSSSITIAAGQTTGTATVTAVQDTLDETDETIVLDISSVSGGDGATESGSQQVTVTITDDDAEPTLSIADVSLTEGNSGSSAMTFTVSLSTASSKAITVAYATADNTATAGSDYTAVSGTLTFNPGETSKTFNVNIAGDSSPESDETFTVTLSSPTNASLADSTASGTILNDESVNQAPVNTQAPLLSGTATVGNALSANTGSWTDADSDPLTYSYQWYRADDNSGTNLALISGAISASYTLTVSDAHKYLRVVVTANDGRGGSQTAMSAYTAVTNSEPVNTTVPSISGTAAVGNALTTSNGSWTDADGDNRTYSYQWYRADDNSGTNLALISGAISASYTLTVSDAHKYLRVVVTANDGRGGSQTAMSAYTAVTNSVPVNTTAPSISGTAAVGNALTTSNGSWTDADGDNRTYSYQWYRADDNNGTNLTLISGAISASYTLTSADSRKYLRVVVTANDGRGGSQTAVSAYAVTTNSAPVNTTAPNINGTATVGNPLTASNGSWTDADNDTPTYSYQWYRADDSNGTNLALISGAISASYTLTTNDAHKYLRVVVTANDGNSGTQTADSSFIAVTNSQPQISGTADLSIAQGSVYSFTPSATDPDADDLTFSIVNQPSWASFDPATGALTGTPTNADVGTTAAIVISVSDGGLTAQLPAFSLTVSNVNDAPVISGTPAVTVAQGAGYSFIPTASDIDVGTTLTFSIVNKPSWATFNTATGALTGTPANGDVGSTAAIVISVSDGELTAQLPAFNLAVSNVNDAPVISGTPAVTVAQGMLYSFTPTASDIDAGTTLTFSIVNKPSWAIFNTATGALTGTPANGDVGSTAAIVISVSDGELTAQLPAFSLAVSNVNDAPVISGTPAVSVEQGTAYSFIPTVSDIDVGTTLTFSIVNKPSWAIFNTATGALTGTPANGDVGSTAAIVISVSDGELTAQLPAFSLAVSNVNDAPVISGTPAVTVAQGAAYSFIPTASDIDVGTTLTFSIANKPSWATFNPATGALTGSPANADVGVTAGIVISVSDGEFTAALPAFSLTVTNVNDLPVVTGREVTLAEDSSATLILSGEDQDGDELSFAIVSQPEHGTATLSGNTLVYTAAADYHGTDSLSFVASDAVAASEPATISFQVTPVNDAPVAVNDSYTLPRAANHQYALNVLANDSDVDGDTLTIDGASSSVGTVALNAQGLTLTVPELYVGPVSLSYTLIDGKGGRAKADVSLIIEGGAATNLPVITVPADINTNATALFTRVPLGTATAVDNNGRRLRVSLVNGSLFFAPGAHLVYWQATDAAGNTATKAQKVNVSPLVSLSKDQLVSEGNEVVVDIILNGPAPAYPVKVPYTVTGSADGNDHTLVAGVAEISSGTSTQLRFTVLEDSQVEGNEDIVVTLDASLNLGSQRTSRILISDSNIAPVVALSVQQQGENRLTVSQDAGEVSINATVTDANSSDLVSGEWRVEKLTNVTSTTSALRFDPAEQAPGLYEISYTATDNGTPMLSASNRVFVVIRPALPTLTPVDSDGDLIPDDQEGFADSDNDGIPDYLDAISECNVMPTELLGQTEFVAEGDPGVCLRLGTIAATTDAGGLQISKDAVNTDTVAVNIGGIFDFIAYGLPEQGQSYSLVLPQRLPVPANAVYRKFSEMMGWVDFVSNSQNSVASSQGERGYCPPPGDASWSAGLTEGHWCVQVTVQDGGPNDADGIANGAIVDPGGVAVALDGNQLPVATADTASTFGDVAVVVNVLANDSDADGDALTVSQAVAGFGVVTILADQQLSYLPNADFIGTDVLVYSVTDGKGGTASAELTIRVLANTAPVAVNDAASTDDKTAISIAVLANDKDDDGQRLTISTASAEQGSVTISADQKLLYTPKRGFNGVDTIRYSIQDGVGGSASAEVKVTVQAYVDVLINNKSSGGGSLTLWLVLGLAAAVVLRRKPRLLASALLLLAPASQAAGDWYGQVGAGLSRADVVESRLATQAPAGVLLEFDKKSQSYSLNLGYQWLPRLGLELGYLDLGNAGVNIKSDSLTPAQYHELVKAVSPVLVDGWTLAARWTLWQNDSFRLELPVGMMRWESNIRSQMGDSVKKTTAQGTDPFYGLQLNYQFAADWQLAVAVQELDLAPNAVSHWQLLLRYQF